MKRLLGLLVLIAALLAVWQPWCAEVCRRQHDAWFAVRYDASVPLFLTSDDSLLATLPPETKTLLDRLEEPIGDAPEHPSCAVVGNSGNLRGSFYGGLIDSHDYVFRINGAPVKGYEEDVGSRTTHHVSHSNFPSVDAYDDSTQTLLIVDDFNIGSAQQYRDKLGIDLRWLLHQWKPGAFPKVDLPVNPMDPENYFPGNLSDLKGGVRIVHPNFVRYVDERWFAPGERRKIDYPSTGFKTVILALHVCERVDVFGFGINYKKKSWDHYFDDEGSPLWEFPAYHRASYQEQFMDELDRRGIIHLYRGKR